MRRGIGRLRAGGSWFNPLTLFAAGEQGAWYDPSDFSTMWQDSAGTTPVTAVGQPVGKILDKSGRGNHATQATTTSRPFIQQDSSGFYHLAFDGVDDQLLVIYGASINQPCTGAVVFSYTGVPNNSYVYDDSSGAQIALFIKGTNAPATYAGTELLGSALSTSTPYVIQSFYNGASSEQRVNTAGVTSGAAGANASNGMRLGAANVSTNFLANRNYGVIFISRALTAAEKTAVDHYLGAKAGLAL